MPVNLHQKFLNELPDDWEKVPIEKLGAIQSGGTPSRNEPTFWDGTIAWATPTDLTTLKSKWLSETKEYITEKGLARSAAKLLPEGTLLITTRATIGNIAISAIPVCTNQGFKNVVPNTLTNSTFYYFLLQEIVPEFYRLASGSTFLEISRRDFVSIVVPRPEPDEQCRIATRLEAVDAAIQFTQALINKLRGMKAGLMQDLLTRGLDRDGKLRDPFRNPRQFKDSPLGPIPKQWDITELGKILLRTEYGISTALNDLKGIPILRMNNLQDGEIDVSDLKFSTTFIGTQLMLRPLDVLFNRTNSIEHVGRAGIWRGQLELASFASYLVRLVPDETRLIPEYLNAWLNLPSVQLLIKSYATLGVQQANINPTNLRKVWMRLPRDTEEQKAIVAMINSHNQSIQVAEADRKKLFQIKRGLMRDFFTGRVRVPATDMEVIAA